MKLSNDSLRQEIKYKVFFRDISGLYSWLDSSSFFKESYEPRVVNSLYFDTPNYDFAASNMSGESSRIKLRARWYSKIDNQFIDDFILDSQVFNFEVKRKINSLSDKLNVGKISYEKEDDYYNRINSLENSMGSICKNNPALSGFNLLGTVFTSYEREYYELSSDNNLRLTIDKNISYCGCKLPSDPILMAKDFVIVELKFNPNSRKKVNAIMKDFPYRQVRSSKFLASIAQIQRVSY
jgi:SPX domain protein involved in polyphosphate accumulation